MNGPKPTLDKPETAKYTVGQLIHHTLFDYRGVIVDVDPQFRVGAEMKSVFIVLRDLDVTLEHELNIPASGQN